MLTDEDLDLPASDLRDLPGEEAGDDPDWQLPLECCESSVAMGCEER
jgi:hypothetical protein